MVTKTTTNNNLHMNNNEENDIDQDDGMQDLGLPVSLQTFLWRQIAPFIRPKLGKLHEASCMFCQHAPGHHESKEACKVII
ncbi:protein unc-80 homolog [Bactrocera dorsalis]|uniref:Protein unc-80 homolog n=1 Tax=Bactrocera dorsalis TaxID=27457 RepID=A0ABM3J6V5_BACDO|nr:protein unc-80 homolog [Bactrocera dorsalis]